MLFRSRGVLLAVAAVFATATGGVAQAQTPSSSHWSCRASAAYAAGLGQRTEPLAANASSRLCANDDAGPTNVDLRVGPARVQLSGVAKTTISPEFGVTRDQGAGADASAETIRLAVGSLVLQTDRAQAKASAACVGGSPVLRSTGDVGDIRLNGVTLPLSGPIKLVANLVNGLPLGTVLRIVPNEVTRSGGAATGDESLTRRALHVQVLQGSALQADVVIAEARTGRTGQVCAPPPPSVCPQGAVFDQARAACLLVLTNTAGGGGERVIVLGAPADLPRGGHVMLIDTFLNGPGRAYRGSPCAGQGSVFGARVAFFGSGQGDRISGSRLSDRIFGLGGKDRLSGALRGDCIEGGDASDRVDGGDGNDTLLGGPGPDTIDGSRDNDRLTGGSGRDRLYGGSGRDRISGGASRDTMEGAAGADRLAGGRGNDYLSGGPGADRLAGGPGKDAINTGAGGTGRVDRVSAGPGNDTVVAVGTRTKARINCGPGTDTVRITPRERRHLKRCERILVVRRTH
jgi:RTX calcium-binding nonapeptide repeat (4 copies)